MSLQIQIETDFKDALKNRETLKVSVLRMLKSALKNNEIALKKELTDQEVGEIVTKEVKQRKDSTEQFKIGNRKELAEKEEAEIKVLVKYLPKQLSDQELAKIIDSAISKSKASNPADMGKVMGQIMPQVKGKADGSLVSKIVRDKLNN